MTAPLPEEQARRIVGDLVGEACERFAVEITEILVQYLRTQGALPKPTPAAQRGADVVARIRRTGRRQIERRPR